MGIIWCVCEKIQDFSSDTYSLERGGDAEKLPLARKILHS